MHLFVQIHPLPEIDFVQSFEGLAMILANQSGMYFEMDGSFVWVDHQADPPCQMDGMVYDRDGRLEYVEVKGTCNATQWNILCEAISGEAGLHSLRIHEVSRGEWGNALDIARQLKQRGQTDQTAPR